MRMECLVPVCVAFGLVAGLVRAEKPLDAKASSGAVEELAKALKGEDGNTAKIAGQPFAAVPLSKEDAARARALLWDAHVAALRKDRSGELEKKELKEGTLVMPFFTKTFGEKPAAGRSLWISLHGGGGAPARVNDSQYENQKKLYQPAEGIYLAPRAPTNTWNLWHEGHMDRFFARLVEDFVAMEGVNPDRVYLMGYSAGGDGVYQMAPRMADWWAGAAMMAGHPNGVSLLSLRNVPFALQVGANDNAYNRAKIGAEYGEQLGKLRKEDPKGYESFVRIREGKGHWMNLEDKEALPWLANFSRNPVPDRVVWKQTGPTHDRSYWLAVPKGKAKGGALVIAERGENRVNITQAEDVDQLIIRLDDRMIPFNGPVVVEHKGKVVHSAPVTRTIGTLAKTLAERGDPKLMFDAEVEVRLGGK
ncbi:MAG: alpha/beta hydrolase [Gemmataceae bacterium]